jgi:formate--tetrahydrofolate ligase
MLLVPSAARASFWATCICSSRTAPTSRRSPRRDRRAGRPPRAKYVVVTAITPTPLGEGKTTTTVGLGQAMRHIGKTAVLSIRQPSMGPTFGIKGGAAGGGYSQVVPMELSTCTSPATCTPSRRPTTCWRRWSTTTCTTATTLDLDPHNITWRRVLDVNDRALRNIVIGLGGKADGVVRQTGFDITAASEVMAILALSTSLATCGHGSDGSSSATRRRGAGHRRGLGAAGAMAVIMRDALKPNLLQTLEHTPVLVHAGPFGNIATRQLVGRRRPDRDPWRRLPVTEAGFGADMGAERFFNIKCRTSGLTPDAAVLVATVRALKAHSGRHGSSPAAAARRAARREPRRRRRPARRTCASRSRTSGCTGSRRWSRSTRSRPTTTSEHEVIREVAEEMGARVAVSHPLRRRWAGAVELAEAVAEAARSRAASSASCTRRGEPAEKIETVATKVYGADGVDYAPAPRASSSTTYEAGRVR